MTATVAVVFGIVVTAEVSAVGAAAVNSADVVAVLVSVMILSAGSGFFGTLRICVDMHTASTAAVPKMTADVLFRTSVFFFFRASNASLRERTL